MQEYLLASLLIQQNFVYSMYILLFCLILAHVQLT